MRISEKKRVEGPVARFADASGILRLKVNVMGNRGWPDHFFFFPVEAGGLLVIEFKAPGEEPEPLQLDKIRKLRKRGYDVHVVDSKEEGIRLLKARMEAAKGAAGGDQVHGVEPVRAAVGRPRRR